jgi:DNA repair protein RadC
MIEYKTLIPEITLKFKTGNEQKAKISTSQDCFKVMLSFYDMDLLELTESFIVLFLNRANNTIGWLKVSSGGIAGTIVEIRLIMATAIKCAASGIILSHNHPSGNVTPSDADIKLTRKIKEAALLFDIALIDHIIMSSDSEKYYSMADEGII